MRQSGHLGAIEGLRAIAVLAVVALHMLRVGYGSTAGWGACGARGVDLFFAISGFCLAYPFLRTWHAGVPVEISFSQFLARRIGRIGPPYWVALGLFALLSLTPVGLPTASTHPDAASALRELGLDAAFLTNRAPVFDSSFWTLGIEMRWYLLFPFLLRLYARSRLAFAGVAAACYALYFFTPYSVADAGTLPCFMLGMVAADLIIRRHAAIRYALPIALGTIGVAAWQQAHDESTDLANPLWHAAAFFAVLTAGDERMARVLRFGPLAFVGVASYSIYLVHEPILESLGLAGLPAPLAAIVAIASGIAFYECVERPMLRPEFRERIEAALLRALRFYHRPPASCGRLRRAADLDDRRPRSGRPRVAFVDILVVERRPQDRVEPRDFRVIAGFGGLDRALRKVVAEHVFRVRATHRRVAVRSDRVSRVNRSRYTRCQSYHSPRFSKSSAMRSSSCELAAPSVESSRKNSV